MGNVRAVTALSKIQRLFDELRNRRWNTTITLQDIAKILGSRGRIAGATLRDAVRQGLLRKKSQAEYELTQLGLKEVHTRATWTPTTVRSFESSPSLSGPRFSSTDSNLDGADSNNAVENPLITGSSDPRISTSSVALRVKVIKDERSESVDGLNTIGSSSLSTTPNRSPSSARARSKRKTKQQLAREKAKAVIAANKQGTPMTPRVSLTASVEQHKAHAMALAYEAQLRTYQSKPFLRFLTGGIVQPGHKRYQQWCQAADQADELDVAYEFYVKAQFYWFDKWFSRAPKPHELRSSKTQYNAKERVRLYAQEIAKGAALPERKVLSRVRTAPRVSRAVRFNTSANQMATLMKNHGATEEEILKVFAKGADALLYFDRDWLRQNQTYQRLKKAKEL